MKKQITSTQELCMSLASNGDGVAFFSLASPFLKEIFLRLRSQGDSFESAAEKTIQTALISFKKIQDVHPENFNEWFKTESDLHFSTQESDNEVSFEKGFTPECNTVLDEAQRYLLRKSSNRRFHRKQNPLSLLSKKYLIPATITLLVILIPGVFFSILSITKTTFSMTFATKSAQTTFTFPFRVEKVYIPNDSLKSDTALVKTDTLPKIDTIVSTPVEQPKPVVKTVPKPRPRAATSELEALMTTPILNTNQTAPNPTPPTVPSIERPFQTSGDTSHPQQPKSSPPPVSPPSNSPSPPTQSPDLSTQ